MKHPIRYIFERLGLVRAEGDQETRYQEADRVVREGKAAADSARRRRLAVEAESYRRGK